MKIFLTASLVLFSLLFWACATRNVQYATADSFVQEQNFSAARLEIEENKEELYPQEDAILYYLDDGMLAFYDRKSDSSINLLSIAERLMEEAYTKSISQEALSFIVNDTLKDYPGEEHEKIFAHIFLALNYLENNNFDDAFVEIKKALNTIQKIQNDNSIIYDSYNKSEDAYINIDEYQAPIIDSAFVRLLSSWLYRADKDINNYEVALRNYNNAIQAQPHLYNFTPPEYSPDQGEDLLSKNIENPNAQIIAFTGRSPIKVAKGFSVNAINQVAVITAHDEEIALNNYNVSQSSDSTVLASIIRIPEGIAFSARFSLPYLARYNSRVANIEIFIENSYIGNLKKTENLAIITQAAFEAKRSFIYAKTISRVIAKALLSVLATSAAKQTDSLFGSITEIVTGLFNNLSEQADLRSARYFPGAIWTGDFLLPNYDTEQNHLITVHYLNNGGEVIHKDTKKASLVSQRSTLNLITFTYLY